MQASEIMTTKVVTVAPETPLRDIARLLLAHGISAVPVVDAAGSVVGMVSEGDLITRDDAERAARRDWWLALLAEGEALSPDFLASLRERDHTAQDIMSAPVVTVSETTDAREIARLLAAYHIKRVPVLRDDRIVGIVSRADLLRAFASEEAPPTAPGPQAGMLGLVEGAVAKLEEHFLHRDQPPPGRPSLESATPSETGVSAADFKALVADFTHGEALRRDEAHRRLAEQRREMVKTLIDQHIDDRLWRSSLHKAREAAEHGAKEVMLLRFPSELCSDGGRAINAPLPDWPKTLRGEAAEIYMRWQRDLKPRGFHLAARVLDFPGGKPGDIGLFLGWKD